MTSTPVKRFIKMSINRQRGAVLLVSMIFLLLLAIIAGTVTQTSILEFFMAGNEQFREEAFQKAQAVVNEISGDLDNFPVVGSVGHTVCPLGCNTSPFPSTLNTPDVNDEYVTTYQVVRRGPLILESLPFRQSESSASSSPNFDAAVFEIDVDVDGSATRLGAARLIQGMAVVVASSAQ